MLSARLMILINDLYNISNSIKVLYDKLCDLEMKGEKDSDLYNKYIDYLRIAIEVEEKEYSKINNDDILACIHNFVDNRKGNIYSRITSKTDDLINLNDSNCSDDIMIANFINELISNVFFSILDEEIINSNRQDLIKYKYDKIYKSSNIENYAIINKFNMSDNHNYIVFIDDLPIIFNDIKNYLLVQQFARLFSLKLVNDFDLNNIYDLIDIIYLRTYLVLLDDEDVKKLYDNIGNISKLDVSKDFLDCMYDIFEKNKNDKEKHKINKLVI